MRLLLVEDDPELAALLARSFAHRGVDVTAVQDERALAAVVAGAAPFAAVLVDRLCVSDLSAVASLLRTAPSTREARSGLLYECLLRAPAAEAARRAGFSMALTAPLVPAHLLARLSTGTASPPAPRAGPPSALLTALALAHGDGVVRVEADAGHAAERVDVVVRHGVVVGLHEATRAHALGRFLHARGRLTTAQATALDAFLDTHPLHAGEALVALGFCSAVEALGLVERAIRERAREVIAHGARAALVPDARDDESRCLVDVVDVVDVGSVDARALAAARCFLRRPSRDVCVDHDALAHDAALVLKTRGSPLAHLERDVLDQLGGLERATSPGPPTPWRRELRALARLVDDAALWRA